MVLGICHVTVHLPETHSLKEKRRTVKSIIQRVRTRFNVSIAEVGNQDVWQTAEIGFVAVSTSGQHADQSMQSVLRFIEANLAEGFVADIHTEILHAN